MSEWKFLTLKEAELEFIDGDRGVNYPKKSELLPEGDCVFLNTGNVRQNSFDFSNLDFITKEKDNLLRNGKLQRDDIVLTTRGTVGNVALYSQEVPFSNIRINSGMVIIRVNKNFWHPYFIYLFFQSHLFKKQISRLISGSAQPQLPISILETVNIPQLTLDEQKEIIFNIKSIDQKIQINNQINQELEAMAKTLYDYWFVQFDFPDQNGNPYKSSGGKMVYHPELKREIPERWGVEKLGDISQYVSEKVGSSELNKENYVGTDNMIADMGGIELTTSIPKSGTSTKFSVGDILISNIRPYFKKIWLSDRTGGCSADVLCIRTNRIIYKEFVYATLARDDFFNYDVAGSKGSKMPRGDKKHIMEYPIVFEFEIADQFSKIVRPIYEAVHKNYNQNQELTQLRDWLLPMLMNGQVRVEDKT